MENLINKYEAFKALHSNNKHEYIEEQINKLTKTKKFNGFKEEMKKLKEKKLLKKELKQHGINEGLIKKMKKK